MATGSGMPGALWGRGGGLLVRDPPSNRLSRDIQNWAVWRLVGVGEVVNVSSLCFSLLSVFRVVLLRALCLLQAVLHQGAVLRMFGDIELC